MSVWCVTVNVEPTQLEYARACMCVCVCVCVDEWPTCRPERHRSVWELPPGKLRRS